MSTKITLVLVGISTFLVILPGCFLGRHGGGSEFYVCSSEWRYEKPYAPTAEDTLFEQAWVELGYGPNYIDSALHRWNEESVPASASELKSQNDTVRTIYEFFRDYYALDSQYRVPEYVVLQGSVSYTVLDSATYSSYCSFDSGASSSEDPQFAWTELKDFRPAINAAGIRLIYLTDAHARTLNYFFNAENGYDPCLKPCIGQLDWSILRSKEEKLAKRIPLVGQHWCIGFHYFSFPVLLSLVFSGDLSRAKINTMERFNSGQYLEYTRSDAGWKKMPHRTTREWIE